MGDSDTRVELKKKKISIPMNEQYKRSILSLLPKFVKREPF